MAGEVGGLEECWLEGMDAFYRSVNSLPSRTIQVAFVLLVRFVIIVVKNE